MSQPTAAQPGDIAGLLDLVLQYGAACRREGVDYASGVRDNRPEVDALRQRVQRRIRRLEQLGRMGGIEPSDVRAALVGTWRN